MSRAILLALFSLSCAAAHASDAACVSTSIKPGDKPCGGISASGIVAGSKKGAAPPRPAAVQPDPASMPIPVGVVIEVSPGKKPSR